MQRASKTIQTGSRLRSFKALAGTMRPSFLVLTPVVMSLGMATAAWEMGRLPDLRLFILALTAGIAAHIGVNALNEYLDFKSGLDSHTRRTAFSGGSGSLQANPGVAVWALLLGITSTLSAGLIGLFFIFKYGMGLVFFVVIGMLVVFAYTPFLTKNPLACLVAPGLGLGIVMVVATHFILTGHYSPAAFWASLVPFFLVNDLLLLNQFPDVDADRRAGRRHLPLAVGRRKSSYVYVLQLFSAYMAIVFGIASGHLPWQSMLAFLVIPLAVNTAAGVIRYADDMERLEPFLGKNVLLNLSIPVLMATGLVWAACF